MREQFGLPLRLSLLLNFYIFIILLSDKPIYYVLASICTLPVELDQVLSKNFCQKKKPANELSRGQTPDKLESFL